MDGGVGDVPGEDPSVPPVRNIPTPDSLDTTHVSPLPVSPLSSRFCSSPPPTSSPHNKSLEESGVCLRT